MKCINKISTFLVLCAGLLVLGGCGASNSSAISKIEQEQYNRNVYQGELRSGSLCVTEKDVISKKYKGDQNANALGLYDVKNKEVLYSYNAHEKIYPASLTKVMTAYVVLQNSSLEDEVKVSAKSAASSFPSDAQVCGLKEGDVWTMEALLNALLLYSGNDVAAAIAEHVSGSEEAFVDEMNRCAKELLAVNTHFANSHGLHENEHYTTAYDLYLIFNECIKDERFVNIIKQKSYTATYKASDDSKKQVTFMPTNLYATGQVELPKGAVVLGGKTGTTGEAGYCLMLLSEKADGEYYISTVMGAENKPALYEKMTALINSIPSKKSN